MTTSMRPSTLETMGLGSVLGIFSRGRMPVDAGELVDKVFGSASRRGALVISGANGIVGAGKAMQLGSRLAPYGVPIVASDLPELAETVSWGEPGAAHRKASWQSRARIRSCWPSPTTRA